MRTRHLRAAGLRRAEAGPFDFALDAGACLAVTGPSGAGKSLMLRMLADLDPHEGDAFFQGRSCRSMTGPQWRSRVMLAAAESGWWHERVGAHFSRVPQALAARLALPDDIFDRAVAACSTGERQRLALLRALEARSPVLLLDEPTGALDVAASARVEAVLRECLQAGLTLVLVTHDVGLADRLATRRGHLDHGRLVMECGT